MGVNALEIFNFTTVNRIGFDRNKHVYKIFDQDTEIHEKKDSLFSSLFIRDFTISQVKGSNIFCKTLICKRSYIPIDLSRLNIPVNILSHLVMVNCFLGINYFSV